MKSKHKQNRKNVVHPVVGAIKQQQAYKKRDTLFAQKEQQEMLGDLNKADIMVAEQYKHKYKMNDHGKLYPMSVKTDDFSQYGVGLQLFFDFIKMAALVFLIMALISSVSIYSNYTGDGLADSYGQQASFYNLMSLANQPQLVVIIAADGATDAEIEAIQIKNDKAAEDFIDEMALREKFIVLPDIAYTIVFLFFIYYWKKQSKKIKKEAGSQKATPSYYAIYIENLPSDFLDEQQLKDHFTPFGKVAEAKIVRDYKGTLVMYKQEADLRQKIAVEKQKAEQRKRRSTRRLMNLENSLYKSEQKKQKINDTVLGGTLKNDNYPALGAYIVFNEHKSKMKCLQTFQKAHSLCATKPKICFLGKTFLRLQGNVDEPSNIQWENLDASRSELAGRHCCVVIMIICILFLTFIVIFVANIVKPTNSNNCPQSEISFEEAQDKQENSYFVECYCKQISPAEIYEDKEKKAFCWDSYIKFVSLIITSIVFVMVVGIVNFLLKIMLRKLGRFSRYATITQETLGITMSLFIAMFINTAILTLLFQSDIYGFVPAVTISEPIPPLKEIQDEKAKEFSSDFDRSWYIEVGAKIVYAMGFNIISPHLLFLFLLPFFRWRRGKAAKKAIIQRVMNNNMLGPEYSITQYYAILLMTIFATMLYASGMPILLWFAFFSLVVQYWVYKYMLLRYNKRPPSYDHKLNKKIMKILPTAAIIHLCFGIYMYSSPLILPQTTDDIKGQVTGFISNGESQSDIIFSHTGETQNVYSRISSQPYMLALLLIIIFKILFQKTIGHLWVKLKKCCCKKKIKVEKQDKFLPYDMEYENIQRRMIASYDIKLNPRYAELINAIDNSTKTIETEHLNTQTGENSPDQPFVEKNMGSSRSPRHQKYQLN